MANKKHKKTKHKHGKKDKKVKNLPWEGAHNAAEDRRVAAYLRLMDVEQRLYDYWKQRSDGEIDWVGEALGCIVDEDTTLWLAAIGDKVAALGGHLELIAVLPDHRLTLLEEPGLNAATPPDDSPSDR